MGAVVVPDVDPGAALDVALDVALLLAERESGCWSMRASPCSSP
jgi:hypothetical protein